MSARPDHFRYHASCHALEVGMVLQPGSSNGRGIHDEVWMSSVPARALMFAVKARLSAHLLEHGEAELALYEVEPLGSLIRSNLHDSAYPEARVARRVDILQELDSHPQLRAILDEAYGHFRRYAVYVEPLGDPPAILPPLLEAYLQARASAPLVIDAGWPVERDPAFVYHITNAERAAEIADAGVMQAHEPWAFTDQECWPDGSVEPRVYFGESSNLMHFAPDEGEPTLLRMPRRPELRRDGSTPDLYIASEVDANSCEVLAGDGQWRPLSMLADLRLDQSHDSISPGIAALDAPAAFQVLPPPLAPLQNPQPAYMPVADATSMSGPAATPRRSRATDV